MTWQKLHIYLKRLRKYPWLWNSNMNGYFNFGGQELSDHQIRLLVEYGISKGYRLDCDIPGEEVDKLLKEHKNDRILYLSLKREWFLKIIAGTKNEEYREMKEYWLRRLFNIVHPSIALYPWEDVGISPKGYTHVCFINGRDANKCPRIEKEIESISIGQPKEGMCPKEFLGKEYFVIKFK